MVGLGNKEFFMPQFVFEKTAYQNPDDFIFGKALHPVDLPNGMRIGGGTVYPEINFTLPPMTINQGTMKEVVENYRQIITGVCERARDLSTPGFVAEIETLPPMTFNPEWGTQVARTVVDIIKDHSAKYGIKGAVRITPNDIREGSDLEHMWHGRHWDMILETFESCARAGADFLAIESVGGKEVHDDAIMYGDLKKALFALSVLGCRDMEKLWTAIVDIAERTNTIASGDTACAFGNTALVLADKNYVSKVFAAVIRVMTAVRSLVALECGARGPHKDCGYEGVYIKAITGTPIATEGRTAACAHLSPLGNVAACLADLWSNESVQNIKLLGGMAPTVSFEQLTYDCRLMNGATAKGKETALQLRDLHADSDSPLDPQAYILRPDVVLRISKELVAVRGRYERTRKAAELALREIEAGFTNGRLNLSEREQQSLESLKEEAAALPATEQEIIADVMEDCEKLDPGKYDLV
jgi:methanol--5-hydroxybenzimidazolylcobamide Co-methyltransferase